MSIRICPHHAKSAYSTKIEEIGNFKYTVAIPAPALFGQFNGLDNIDFVLTGLKKIGFDHVFEVSRAAELVSEATRRLIKEDKLKKPISRRISSKSRLSAPPVRQSSS